MYRESVLIATESVFVGSCGCTESVFVGSCGCTESVIFLTGYQYQRVPEATVRQPHHRKPV